MKTGTSDGSPRFLLYYTFVTQAHFYGALNPSRVASSPKASVPNACTAPPNNSILLPIRANRSRGRARKVWASHVEAPKPPKRSRHRQKGNRLPLMLGYFSLEVCDAKVY